MELKSERKREKYSDYRCYKILWKKWESTKNYYNFFPHEVTCINRQIQLPSYIQVISNWKTKLIVKHTRKHT